ncbi:hypothetical protein N665_2199s0004 [Sinapis alba]|nr:hypothetical protein N665_2199s0004 [Sinapis alba]
MDNNLSSASSASSRNRLDRISSEASLCHCSRRTKKTKSWTDKNPGRRFYRCQIHGFLAWADVDEASGWQKLSLLEARDQIRCYEMEIRQLREIQTLRNESVLQAEGGSQCTTVGPQALEEKAEEIRGLQVELLRASDREKMLRQIMVLSRGGFIAVTAIIVTTLRT